MTRSVVDRLDKFELAGKPTSLDADIVRRTVAAALAEDIGGGDVTSESAVPDDIRVKALTISREPGVLAGIEVFEAVFRQVSSEVQVDRLLADGHSFEAWETLAVVTGMARPILTAERIALNFFQRMCGIAHSNGQVRRSGQGYRHDHPRYQENRARTSDFRQVFGARRRGRKPPHGGSSTPR